MGVFCREFEGGAQAEDVRQVQHESEVIAGPASVFDGRDRSGGSLDRSGAGRRRTRLQPPVRRTLRTGPPLARDIIVRTLGTSSACPFAAGFHAN